MSETDKQLIADAKEILPFIKHIEKRSNLLKAFNSVAVLSTPALGIAYKALPALTDAVDKIITPAGLALTAGVLAAGILQVSRQLKSKITNEFFEKWDQQSPNTRQYTMGLIEETIKRPTFKTADNALNLEDLNITNSRNMFAALPTAMSAFVFLPIAPLTHFWNQTSLELSDSHMLAFSAHQQGRFLASVTSLPTPKS